MTEEQIIEVGKALLPYLRSDLAPAELGMAAHDACAAVHRTDQRITKAAAFLDGLAEFFDVPRDGLYEHKAAECRAMAAKLRGET